MMKLRILVVALGMAVLTGCASGPSGVERWVESLPSTGAGGANLEQSGVESGQLASETTDPCSGSRRMARIRCRW